MIDIKTTREVFKCCFEKIELQKWHVFGVPYFLLLLSFSTWECQVTNFHVKLEGDLNDFIFAEKCSRFPSALICFSVPYSEMEKWGKNWAISLDFQHLQVRENIFENVGFLIGIGIDIFAWGLVYVIARAIFQVKFPLWTPFWINSMTRAFSPIFFANSGKWTKQLKTPRAKNAYSGRTKTFQLIFSLLSLA